jgi:hypothetical protein
MEDAAMSVTLPSAWARGMRKEADMAMSPVSTDLHSGLQFTRSSLLLVIALLLVLVAALVLAANTPWVLDQPIQPYSWAGVP